MLNHKDHDHEATPQARAKCRATHNAREVQVDELIRFFDRQGDTHDWIPRGALRFHLDDTEVDPKDIRSCAHALLDYFDYQGTEVQLAWRRANGYTITREPSAIRSIILRSFS